MDIAIRRKVRTWLKPKLAKKYFKVFGAVQEGYCENHHILPKSIFPEFANSQENIVRMPVANHFRAHEILAKTDSYEMHLAFHMMFLRSTSRYSGLPANIQADIISKRSLARENMAKAQSIRRKGKYLGQDNAFYGKTHSDEAKSKMSTTHKGKKLSEEHISILVACHKGKPKRKVKCPHCGILIANHAKNRLHFDNCKEK